MFIVVYSGLITNNLRGLPLRQSLDLIEVTGLWSNKAKDGSIYYSGYLGSLRLLAFPNRNKEPGSNQPDFRLCVGENKKRKEGSIKTSASIFQETHNDLKKHQPANTTQI